MYRAKLPRPTVELIRSMQNVGEILDRAAERDPSHGALFRVCAATCYTAGFRIQELATLVEEIAPIVDTRKTPGRKRR